MKIVPFFNGWITGRRKLNGVVLQVLLLVSLFLSSLSVASLEPTIKLESRVTGNQEQPTVLYIVPWKSPRSIEYLKQPLSSKVTRVFQHVERSELQREINYRKRFNKTSDE